MRHRLLLTAVVTVLLLMMQQEASLHALQHDGKWFEHAREQGLQAPADTTPCAQCALLAGGTSALSTSIVMATPVDAVTSRVAFDFTSRPAALPSYYSSRAPPVPA